ITLSQNWVPMSSSLRLLTRLSMNTRRPRREVVCKLKAAGASWIQFDEPTLVMDLDSHKLQAFTEACSELESSLSGLNVGVTGFGFDLVRGTNTLDLIKAEFPKGKYLFAGVVDGRNIWANDLAASLNTLGALEGIVGKDKLVVSTSCSLLHTAVDLVNETKLDKEIKSWLAFAAQKVVEVNVLAKTLAGQKDEEELQYLSDPGFETPLKRFRGVIIRASNDPDPDRLKNPDYDVLVHGEPERNDMVKYFGEQLSGFAFTANGWVQSYGSRCAKPPIIYGDVSRPKPMTVFWSSRAQTMTSCPMKGMLTGPVTINWSFVRNDQPRFETCYQISLAIKDEVEDLETAGIKVIQIDKAALREGLPLRKSEHAFYLDRAVHSFRITNCGVKDATQRGGEVGGWNRPRIPSTEEIADRINKMLTVLKSNILWANPDCGLKTRKYAEVKPALQNMVAAAKLLRTQLA
ncbi:hypothetical protein CRG98_024230, partial [Punica granatum]